MFAQSGGILDMLGGSPIMIIAIVALVGGILLRDPETGDTLLSIFIRSLMAMFKPSEPVSQRLFRNELRASVDLAKHGNLAGAKAAMEKAEEDRAQNAVLERDAKLATSFRAGGIMDVITGLMGGNMMPILLIVGAVIFLPMITGGGGCGGGSGGGCKAPAPQAQQVEQDNTTPTPIDE